MIMLLKQHYFNLAQELPIATWQKMAKSEKKHPPSTSLYPRIILCRPTAQLNVSFETN